MPLWPPSVFTALLVFGAIVSIWARRRLRIVDGLLFAAFAYAALTAQRNIFLMAFWAPVVIATYAGAWTIEPRWERPLALLTAAALAVCAAIGIVRGDFFQLRVAEWRFPKGAADFLAEHHVTSPMFNTYEYGGYLIWRLWPQEKAFIDGRALSESIFLDYAEILYNRDNAQKLLDRYGIEVIVMNTFEYSNGLLYNLAPALGDPNLHEWKLVYSDPQAVIFMRTPPNGVQVLPWSEDFDHLEAECRMHMEHRPAEAACARTLGQVFSRIGAPEKARRWLGIYLDAPHPPDPEAENAYRQLVQ